MDYQGMIKGIVSKAKSLALGVTEIELKVLEATNEEPWGPHGSVMTEIARAAENYDSYPLIMNIITQRLDARDENWRLCYKALLLLDFLIKQGPPRIVSDIKSSQRKFERLRDDFEYRDVKGVDQGINVKNRARELIALVNDPSRIQEERERASKNSGKYTGVSSSEMRGGGGGGGSGGFSSSISSYVSGFGGTGGSGGGGGGGGGGSGRSGGGGFSTSKPSTSSSSSYAAASSSRSSRPSDGGGGARLTRPSDTGGRSTRPSDAGEKDEDPFEATRRRIASLKKDNDVLGPPQPAANIDPALVDSGPARAPRKLKDVKINPAMAATFATMTQTGSGSDSSPVRLALAPPPGPSRAAAFAAAAPPAASPPPPPAQDLLSLLDDDFSPAAVPAAPAASAVAAAAPVEDEWASFAGRAAPSQQVPAATSSHTAAASDTMAGFSGLVASSAAPPAAAGRPELSLMDFGEPFPSDPVAPARPAAASFPAAAHQPSHSSFPMMTPSAPLGGDPFAAFASRTTVAPTYGGISNQYPSAAPSVAANGLNGSHADMGGFVGAFGGGSGASMGGFVSSTTPASPAGVFGSTMGGTGAPAKPPQPQLGSGSAAAAARAKDPFAGLGF